MSCLETIERPRQPNTFSTSYHPTTTKPAIKSTDTNSKNQPNPNQKSKSIIMGDCGCSGSSSCKFRNLCHNPSVQPRFHNPAARSNDAQDHNHDKLAQHVTDTYHHRQLRKQLLLRLVRKINPSACPTSTPRSHPLHNTMRHLRDGTV